MTPTESRKVWDIESRMEKQAHRRRVLTVFGVFGFGAVSLWLLIEGVVAAAHWLGGVL